MKVNIRLTRSQAAYIRGLCQRMERLSGQPWPISRGVEACVAEAMAAHARRRRRALAGVIPELRTLTQEMYDAGIAAH